MDDRALLKHYVGLGSPDAARWNHSVECLEVELAIRRTLVTGVKAVPPSTLLNIGIGTGTWDDFVGYWLEGTGTVVSLDRDPAICASFRYRQHREGHPNRASVICGDLLSAPLPPAAFDIVTMIGSTSHEIGDCNLAVTAASSLVKPGGTVFINHVGLGGVPRLRVLQDSSGTGVDWVDWSAELVPSSVGAMTFELYIGRRRTA